MAERLENVDRILKNLPDKPGCYQFFDAEGNLIYIGKAKNLRARAGSYFLKAAAEDQRTTRLVREAYDIDYIDAESEVQRSRIFG